MQTQKKITIPGHLYDSLEFAAHRYGGVGKGYYFKRKEPCCIHGFAMFVRDSGGGIDPSLLKAGLGLGENDDIVENAPRALRKRGRLSWDDYTRLGNIVRGR